MDRVDQAAQPSDCYITQSARRNIRVSTTLKHRRVHVAIDRTGSVRTIRNDNMYNKMHSSDITNIVNPNSEVVGAEFYFLNNSVPSHRTKSVLNWIRELEILHHLLPSMPQRR